MRLSVWSLLAAFVSLTPNVCFASGFGDLDVVSAMDALARGDDAKALALVEGYLATPADPDMQNEAHFLAARAALNLNDSERALTHLTGLEQALGEVADFVWAYRAHAYRQQGRWKDALQVWQSLQKKYPDSPLAAELTYGIGDAYFALGKLDDARVAYEAAIKAFPRSDKEPMARYNLAVIFQAKRNWVEAAAGYRYLAYYRVGDPASDLARARFDELVKQGRAEKPNAWQELSRVDVLLSSRSLDEAEAILKTLGTAGLSTTFVNLIRYREAKLAYRKRDFTRAADMFTDLAKTAGADDKVTYSQWLAKTYSTAGRYDDAIRVYLDLANEQAARKDGKEALFKAAWLGYHGGDYQRAVKLFGEFAERYPKDSSTDEAYWYMAWNAYRLGDLATAKNTLVRLREKFPRTSLVQRSYYWEGRFTTLMGDAKNARIAFTEAVSLEPLTYYGVMAQQRIDDLLDATRPVAFVDNGPELASLSDELPERASSSLEPLAEELPELGAMRHGEKLETPWGSAVFDWQSMAGKRALRLMKLGLLDAASDVVAKVPVLKGHDASEVTYARARLLYALGDFNTAYRLVDSTFRGEIKAFPKGAVKRFFQMAYPDAHATAVKAAAREFSISPLLVLSIMRQESAFDDRARSWASAHGLMQIIPPTGTRIAQALGMESYNQGVLRDPATSVRFGAWYLSELVEKYHGNYALAIASYNAGPEAVSSWLDRTPGMAFDEFVEEIPYKETRSYVRRVLGNLAVYRALYTQRPLELPDTMPTSYKDNINF